MRLLVCTDLHGSRIAYKKIKDLAKKADMILCAGDISIFGQDLGKTLKKLNALQAPTLIIPGNHEDMEPLKALCKPLANLSYINEDHGVKRDVLFLGYEGECFSQKDPHFKKVRKKFLKIIKKHKEKKIVLMTHAPPYNTNVDRILDHHAGNKPIRKFIEEVQPAFVICGHLHENFGKKDWIKKTRVINPGPFGQLITI